MASIVLLDGKVVKSGLVLKWIDSETPVTLNSLQRKNKKHQLHACVYCLGRSSGQTLQLHVRVSVHRVGITSLWRFIEGLSRMLGLCQGVTFFLWGGGWGGRRRKMRGLLTVGLAILQGKCGCSWKGSGEQGPEIETVECNSVGRWWPRYLLCCLSSDTLIRVQNKGKALSLNSL